MRLLRAAAMQVQRPLRPGSAAPQVAPAPRVQPARRGADADLRRRARRMAGRGQAAAAGGAARRWRSAGGRTGVARAAAAAIGAARQRPHPVCAV